MCLLPRCHRSAPAQSLEGASPGIRSVWTPVAKAIYSGLPSEWPSSLSLPLFTCNNIGTYPCNCICNYSYIIPIAILYLHLIYLYLYSMSISNLYLAV